MRRGCGDSGCGRKRRRSGRSRAGRCGVAAVEDDGEECPCGHGAGRGEVVVGQRVLPVEVVRAEDLVEPVGRLVAVPVGHLGAVAGVVEDEGVARGGPGGEPGEPVEDRLRGGAASVRMRMFPSPGKPYRVFSVSAIWRTSF